MRAQVLGAGLVLVAAVSVGCTVVELPKAFLPLQPHTSAADYRAVTGDNASFWMREFTEVQAGSLEFWAEALEYDFVQQRGYQVVGKGDLTSSAGPARWIESVANVRGERFGHLIAIWVVPHTFAAGCTVRVAEFTAREAEYQEHVAGVRAALATVR